MGVGEHLGTARGDVLVYFGNIPGVFREISGSFFFRLRCLDIFGGNMSRGDLAGLAFVAKDRWCPDSASSNLRR